MNWSLIGLLALALVCRAEQAAHAVVYRVDYVCAGVPEAINNRGEIVGGTWSYGSYARSRPFLYSRGTWSLLPLLEGHSVGIAADLNDRGQVVGVSGSPYRRAFLYNHGDGSLVDLSPPGVDPDVSNGVDPIAINASGAIVAKLSSGTFLWHDNTITQLGYDGVADINDLGEMTGAVRGPKGYGRAFRTQPYSTTKIDLGAFDPDLFTVRLFGIASLA
jgi:uncharacterized membrane protein